MTRALDRELTIHFGGLMKLLNIERAFGNVLRLGVAAVVLATPLFAQERARIIAWPERSNAAQIRGADWDSFVPTNIEAVEIIDFKVAGVPVVPGQSFSAGEDWLKDLSVRVKNTSGRQIASITMMISFPETRYPKDGMDHLYGYQLEYKEGRYTRGVGDKGKPVAPGEEVELAADEVQYRIDHRRLVEKAGLTSISRATIVAVRVDFVDGAIWEAGRPRVRGVAGGAN